MKASRQYAESVAHDSRSTASRFEIEEAYEAGFNAARFCPGCNSKKHEDEFYKSKVNKSGYYTYCKKCVIEMAKAKQKADENFKQKKRVINKRHYVKRISFSGTL